VLLVSATFSSTLRPRELLKYRPDGRFLHQSFIFTMHARTTAAFAFALSVTAAYAQDLATNASAFDLDLVDAQYNASGYSGSSQILWYSV
jgi:hypothetical protein